MRSGIRNLLSLPIPAALLLTALTACGGSGSHCPSLSQIPRYPDAVQGESMAQSGIGGFLGGNLTQLTTTDSFDEVVAFYRSALSDYHPQVLTHRSELGRQLAITIPQKDGMISVAIQEFTAEGEVNITVMGVGG